MANFFAELKRRHIYRVGAAYVLVAWALTQLVEILAQVFTLPLWIAQAAIVLLAIGVLCGERPRLPGAVIPLADQGEPAIVGRLFVRPRHKAEKRTGRARKLRDAERHVLGGMVEGHHGARPFRNSTRASTASFTFPKWSRADSRAR